MRNISADGLALIKRFEGFSPSIYKCAAGYETIGYGHMLLSGEEFGAEISESKAEELLLGDVQIAQQAVLRLVDAPLGDGQYAALVSFTFNLGAGALQRSTLRHVVSRGEHDAAPAEFLRWVWAGGKRLKGLIRRREAEARLYMS